MRSNASGGGFYNSEPRNTNRGFGRGNPRPYQSSQPPPSPQPPRKGDLFMEAGKLAVEYLVSRGLLSSNVLTGKGQNGSLRNNYGESQDLRSSQDRDIPNSHESRSFASARPGAVSADGVSSSRRSPNDQDMSMSRNYSRERRRYGSSRSYSSDWSRENGREGSLSAEKGTPSQVMEVDNDKNNKDNAKVADTDPHSADSVKKDDDSETLNEIGMCHDLVDSDSKTTSLLQSKDGEELPIPADGVKNECEEAKDGTDNTFSKVPETHKDELAIQHSEENDRTSTKDELDLLKLCPSTEIPTNIHSSLTNANTDPLVSSEEKIIGEIGREPLDSVKDDTTSDSSRMPSSNETPSANCLGTAVSDQCLKEAGTSDPTHALDQQKSLDTLSFTDKTFSFDKKSTGLPDLGMCSSFDKDRGEKRGLEAEEVVEGAKKSRQWLSVARSDEYFQLSDLSDKQSISPSKRSVDIFNESANQDRFTNVHLPLKGGVEAAMGHVENKQLFSSSYKICDLNLMGASDMHESHGVSALLYPSRSGLSNNTSVGVDLSMSNSCSMTNQYNDSGSLRNDIEIIDLESASLDEGKSSNTSTRNMEAGITRMENFPNNPENLNDNPDGQDGYGFMISELLGNDVPNCPPVQPDMNSMQNEMGLHHGEGLFSEDDPIYMSLGEIPLSLLRAWEQPTQERNPFEL